MYMAIQGVHMESRVWLNVKMWEIQLGFRPLRDWRCYQSKEGSEGTMKKSVFMIRTSTSPAHPRVQLATQRPSIFQSGISQVGSLHLLSIWARGVGCTCSQAFYLMFLLLCGIEITVWGGYLHTACGNMGKICDYNLKNLNINFRLFCSVCFVCLATSLEEDGVRWMAGDFSRQFYCISSSFSSA